MDTVDRAMKENKCSRNKYNPITRRNFLKGAAAGAATLAIPVGTADATVWEAFFQKHFQEMTPAELDRAPGHCTSGEGIR